MTHDRVRRRRARVVLVALALVLLSGCLYAPGDPGPADVTLTVDVSKDVHPISPLIYGLNGADAATLAGTRATMLRMGGNRWTAFNWENNASNAGSDWCFQNDGLLSSSNTPGAAVQPTITQARNAGAAALVTVPIVDYVAADKNGGCDVRNSGPNYLQTRFKQNRRHQARCVVDDPRRHRRLRLRRRVRELAEADRRRRQPAVRPRQRARPVVVDARRGPPRPR